MTDNTEAMTPATVADVKHYVITMDADGNEVRTEVKEEQVKKDFANDVI